MFSKTKMIQNIPNLFTLANLSCGVIALVFIVNSFPLTATLFILGAGFFDFLDGKVARRLKINSEFGASLDSLADLVSFGVVPALQYHTILPHGILSNIILILFPVCGALRLARFNTNPTAGYFEGLPITAAGTILPLLMLVPFTYGWVGYVGLLLSYLMISKIRVKKF